MKMDGWMGKKPYHFPRREHSSNKPMSEQEQAQQKIDPK